MEKSYLHKIKDVVIYTGTFKNDQGDQQKYKSVQIKIVSDGQEEVINLSGANAPKPSLLELSLKGADDVRKETESNFLTDIEE